MATKPGRARRTRSARRAALYLIKNRERLLVPLSSVDPETGEMTPVSCFAHAAMIADVERTLDRAVQVVS